MRLMSGPCPNCGASDVTGRVCSYCDGALPHDEATEREACVAFLRSFEGELRGASSPWSGIAFLCFVASGPLVWSFTGSVFATVATSFGLFVAFGGVVNWERRTAFRKKIRPKIAEYLSERSIDPGDFSRYALEDLPPKSRLRRYATWF